MIFRQRPKHIGFVARTQNEKGGDVPFDSSMPFIKTEIYVREENRDLFLIGAIFFAEPLFFFVCLECGKIPEASTPTASPCNRGEEK